MGMNGVPDRSLRLAPIDVSAIDLGGKRVAVVGGTDGLGRAIARLAAERGAEVRVIGRTFRDQGVERIRFVRADLSSMREAQRIGAELDPTLDALILTTGIFAAPEREVTEEGIERDLAISTLSRYAIVRAWAPRVPAGAHPRVFVMGFPGAGNLGRPDDLDGARRYDAFEVHMNTVAANEALVLDAAKRWPDLRVFGLNPGLVKTGIRANYLGDRSLKHRVAETLIGLFTPSPERYAARVLPLLVAPELEGRSGQMFSKAGAPILASEGFDEAHVARLVDASTAFLDRALASRPAQGQDERSA